MKADLLTFAETTDKSSTTAEKIPVYRCSGDYFGFIYNNGLFDATSNYLGWIDDDGYVWHSNGMYLGRLEDDNYILKRADAGEVNPQKEPQTIPAAPIPPFPRPDRLGRSLPSGWLDALECF